MSHIALDLSGKTVLVTGGAGVGVGGGVCQALHQAGARLVINDINPDSLERAGEWYPEATLIAADLENPADVERMFQDIESEVGPLHGLVNNAGIGLAKVAHEVSEAEFMHLYGVDVHAVWRVSRHFVQQCLRAGIVGHIVNISSVHAHSTQSSYAIYCSAKNAIIGLTRGMACEIGPHGMRVNAVGPGYVHAEQNYDLIKNWAEDPEAWVRDFMENQQVLSHEIKAIDIGHLVAFLLSDLARSITGQNIYVDNGTTSLLFNRDFV